jgi:DNA-binding NarL/FixJ family response regulator
VNRPLIVEDNQFIRSALMRTLRRHFQIAEVKVAESVIDAIDILRDGDVDFIISDFNLKGVPKGSDLAAWVTKNAPALGDKFLFFTDDNEAFNYRMPVILKSSSLEALVHFISVLLNHETP